VVAFSNNLLKHRDTEDPRGCTEKKSDRIFRAKPPLDEPTGVELLLPAPECWSSQRCGSVRPPGNADNEPGRSFAL
jgi:hypothetical protein